MSLLRLGRIQQQLFTPVFYVLQINAEFHPVYSNTPITLEEE